MQVLQTELHLRHQQLLLAPETSLKRCEPSAVNKRGKGFELGGGQREDGQVGAACVHDEKDVSDASKLQMLQFRIAFGSSVVCGEGFVKGGCAPDAAAAIVQYKLM